MNAYQIIPGIMYTLQARLHGVVVKRILNDKDIMQAIKYVTRYCYATISAPFNTMHGACCDYGINWKQYLNSCEGDDEAIPVTVLLVSMYNACYTFQDDQRENLLILTLRGLELGGPVLKDLPSAPFFPIFGPTAVPKMGLNMPFH